MDIGHVRTLGWSRAGSQQEWVGYNRLRGQYMSALEHAVPERFFNDPSQCNLEGTTTPNPALPACPQGVSAVKALGIAASLGQRIYTITPEVYANNPGIVASQLAAHGQSTREKVQQALDAGFEVSIHQAPITVSGWSGAGFTLIDPNTGAGGYLIDGGTNGGILLLLGTFVSALICVTAMFFGAWLLVFWSFWWVLAASIKLAVDYYGATAGEFFEAASMYRLLAAFILFAALATPIAAQVLMGAAIIVLLLQLKKWLFES